MSSTEESLSDLMRATEFIQSDAPNPNDSLPIPVPVEVVFDSETGEPRYVTAAEFLDRGPEELLESGLPMEYISMLRQAVLEEIREADPVKVSIDKSGVPRFSTIESKNYALENRESVEVELREMMASKYRTEVIDELIDDMFTGRTDEEPPVIPTNITLFGRPSDEIAEDESSETVLAYADHMEEHWGF